MPGTSATAGSDHILDVVIVGAGQAGIYQLYRLRELGLAVRAIDAAAGVGGVWHWNRYPGARFDSESHTYAYFFSPELIEDWDWSERFAGQPEIERYYNEVVDRFDLRSSIILGERVLSVHLDEDSTTWILRADSGRELRARYVVLALGGLSAPQYPPLPGRDRFSGFQTHTGEWPASPVDLSGQRVGVVGTGPSGVQVITALADTVGSLTVFQRSPHWITPLRNKILDSNDLAEIRATIEQTHRICMDESFAGFLHYPPAQSAYDLTPTERLAFYEEIYARPGFAKWLGNFREVLHTKELNREYCRFLESKIRERVADRVLADLLIPRDHGYGAKRPPFDTGYYEVFERAGVELVDLRLEPLTSVTATGIATDRRHIDLDAIIWATGFDALTGAYDRMDIRGRLGQRLSGAWAGGPQTCLGLQTPGFPNLFSVGGPHSTGGNVPRATEVQVDFVTTLLREARRRGSGGVEATQQGAVAWTSHVMELAYGANSQPELDYNYGGNVPGKKIVFRGYSGGIAQYAEKCRQVQTSGFREFEFLVASTDQALLGNR